MLAAELHQNIQEVATLERAQTRNERKLREVEEAIKRTEDLKYKEGEESEQGGEFRSRVKLREEMRKIEEDLKQNKHEVDRLLRRREELGVSLEAEKTVFLKKSRQRDHERNRTYELERELAASKNELRKMQS